MYTMNFAAMDQTNQSTEVVRKIRRDPPLHLALPQGLQPAPTGPQSPQIPATGNACSFQELREGDHIYTVNLKGLFTHHGIVVEKGLTEGQTHVVELNVPRGTELPERVTPKEVLKPGLLQQMMKVSGPSLTPPPLCRPTTTGRVE